MNYLKELNNDITQSYKDIMKPLYIKYRQLGQQHVSEVFVYWVLKHHHNKAMDRINKANNRSNKFKKMKSEIEELKCELENEKINKGIS